MCLRFGTQALGRCDVFVRVCGGAFTSALFMISLWFGTFAHKRKCILSETKKDTLSQTMLPKLERDARSHVDGLKRTR